jgi:hypothetical protein
LCEQSKEKYSIKNPVSLLTTAVNKNQELFQIFKKAIKIFFSFTADGKLIQLFDYTANHKA